MNRRNEILEKAIGYYHGNTLAADVWLDKYALRNKEKVILESSPADTWERLIKEFDRIEDQLGRMVPRSMIEEMLANGKYVIPAGSPIYGIGNDHSLSSLSNCFVIDSPIDSYGGIMKADQELVQLMKRRGGVGVDISSLRPSNSIVHNAAGTSTGATSFMSRFSHSTNEVAQDGRRGALIITMDVSHPDIEKFIVSKDDLSKITGANISIKVTDAFMIAVENDNDFILSYGGNKIIVKAKRIWDKFIHQAWKTAEPGVLFWDKIISNSPADCYPDFQTKSVNPCGELPLSPYDSCRLLHINLYSFVDDPFTTRANFNYNYYNNIVRYSQCLCDDLVELEKEKIWLIINKINNDPEDKNIKDVEINLWYNVLASLLWGRRTGLNPLLGLADTLAALGMKYDSDEAISFSSNIARIAATASYTASIDMAAVRGPFIKWEYDKEKDNIFIKRILPHLSISSQKKYLDHGRRNISNLTIPPSGTISIIAEVSSGIEPVFALSYKRKRKVPEGTTNSIKGDDGNYWEEYTVYHPKYLDWDRIATIDLNDNSGLSISNPYRGATSHEIDPIKKIKLQGAIQEWIDHSISVTHNLPEHATKEDVSKIYFEAWKHGCKGVTIYREGSRDGVLKTHKKAIVSDFYKRPKVLEGEAFLVTVKGEKFTVIIGLKDGRPFEIFAYVGNGLTGRGNIIKQGSGDYVFIRKEGESFNITNNLTDEQEAITRGYSYALRFNADLKFGVEQLNKTKGDITSFSKAIARVLRKFISTGEVTDLCPECKNILTNEGGCNVCHNCGYSRCS